ncbi:MAG: response regulator [Planctomycetaceae bacterium]
MVSILVVDDSATDRVRIAGLLSRQSDYTVSTAGSGREALDLLAQQPCDLVLTDMQMPDMNGLKLVRELREQHPRIPVILMTGVGSEELAVEAIRGGAAWYVNKTSGAPWLHESVARVLDAHREQSSRSALMQQLKWDEYELSLVNDRVLMSATARFLRQAVGSVDLCPVSELPRLGIALEEALLNACLHGNLELDSKLREGDGQEFDRLARERSQSLPWCDRRVRVSASLTPEQMRVRITDEGPGFDPSTLPDPTDPENLLKPHGRGVMMMRLFVDDVQWNDRGNQVTLIRNRQPS